MTGEHGEGDREREREREAVVSVATERVILNYGNTVCGYPITIDGRSLALSTQSLLRDENRTRVHTIFFLLLLLYPSRVWTVFFLLLAPGFLRVFSFPLPPSRTLISCTFLFLFFSASSPTSTLSFLPLLCLSLPIIGSIAVASLSLSPCLCHCDCHHCC